MRLFIFSLEKVGTCGAVNPRNGSVYSRTFDGFDSDTFIYVIVLDNASPHKSHKTKEFVAKNKKRLELL